MDEWMRRGRARSSGEETSKRKMWGHREVEKYPLWMAMLAAYCLEKKERKRGKKIENQESSSSHAYKLLYLPDAFDIMTHNPALHIHLLFLSSVQSLFLTLLYDSISPTDSCVIMKTVCMCVKVCVHVIPHNPTPSVMAVITSPSPHISDWAQTHKDTVQPGCQNCHTGPLSAILQITLHYDSSDTHAPRVSCSLGIKKKRKIK